MIKSKSVFPNILTERPEGMSEEEYRIILKFQNAALKFYKKNGKKRYLEVMKKR